MVRRPRPNGERGAKQLPSFFLFSSLTARLRTPIDKIAHFPSRLSRSIMSDFDRRQFLKGLLGKLVQAAGSVVVASAAVAAAKAQANQPAGTEPSPGDLQERADQLAANGNFPAEEAEARASEFLNGAFRNTPVGGFRNTPIGSFRNTPIGSFRNGPIGGFRNGPVGGFRNTPVGGFRNTPVGGFGNGGWPNGGWGGFGNGGWPNGVWRNWW